MEWIYFLVFMSIPTTFAFFWWIVYLEEKRRGRKDYYLGKQKDNN